MQWKIRAARDKLRNVFTKRKEKPEVPSYVLQKLRQNMKYSLPIYLAASIFLMTASGFWRSHFTSYGSLQGIQVSWEMPQKLDLMCSRVFDGNCVDLMRADFPADTLDPNCVFSVVRAARPGNEEPEGAVVEENGLVRYCGAWNQSNLVRKKIEKAYGDALSNSAQPSIFSILLIGFDEQ